MSTTDDIFARALELPLSERANLAHRLLLGLDDEPPDPDAEAAWAVELEERLRAVEEGRATLVPWEEVRERLRESLSRSREE